jgi:hypothetical protein
MRLRWLAPLSVVLAFATESMAQSRMTGGDIQGTVVDQQNENVGGADVTVTNLDTNVSRSTLTDTKGRYFLGALPPGRYKIGVELLGFAPETVDEVQLQLGHSVDQKFTLRVAGGAETVVIVEAVPSLDARRTAVAFAVGQDMIEGLPINGRNFINFAALTPGVTTDRTTGRGIIATSGLSFTGQPARSNSLTVDGFDNNDVTTGGVRGQFSQEAIREFQVLTDTYSAEFGRASGGVVNIVTKSGTNDLHGNMFFYMRDKGLNAKDHFEKFDVFGNPINQDSAPFKQRQWGGTVGGPLRKDKTFFFLAYERSDVDASNFVTIDPAIANTFNSLGFPVELGYQPYSYESSQALIKLDHQWSSSNNLSLRGSYSKIMNENAEVWGGLNARSNGGVLESKDWFVSASESDVLSPRWISETRVLVSKPEQSILALDPRCNGECLGFDQGGPQVQLIGQAIVGRVVTSPQVRDNDRFEASQTFSYFRGNHLFKFGGTFAYLNAKALSLPLNFGGSYVFSALPAQAAAALGLPAQPISALQALQLGLPSFYSRAYGNPNAPFKYKDYALFLQDEWRMSDRLTLKIGVRYQRQIFPDLSYNVSSVGGTRFEYPLPQDKNDFAPRLGLSFDPSGDQKTNFHLGYGVYFDDQIAGNISTTTILGGNPAYARTLSLRFPASVSAWRAPGRQLPEPANLATQTSSVIVFDPSLSTPYTHQSSAGFERLIGKEVTLSVNGLYIRGFNQLGALDYNPVIPSLGAGRRPNDVGGVAGTSGAITQYSTYGESWYKALAVALNKSFSHKTQFSLAYTLSKAEDTTTDFFTAPEDTGRGRNPADLKGLPLAFDPQRERGPSINDQRHRLVVSGLYEMPWQVRISTIVTVGSGRPFTPLAGADLNGSADQSTIPPDRARRNPLDANSSVGRGSETTSGTFTVDLRLAKRFGFGKRLSVDALVEAFNLLDRVNYSDINNIFGTGAFPDNPARDAQGRVTYGLYNKALPPRQVQLAMKLNF